MTPLTCSFAATLLLVAVASGCRKNADPVPPHEAAAFAPHANAEARHEQEPSSPESADSRPTYLTLDADALRDLRLSVRKAERRPVGDTILALGVFEHHPDSVAVVSAPVAGRVERVLRAAGDVVKAGDALAELRSVELGRAQLVLGAARAKAESVKLRRDLAVSQLEKKRELLTQQLLTIQEVQAAEVEAAAREAEQRDAETDLRQAELGAALFGVHLDKDAGRVVLRSPIAGTITLRDVSVGQGVDQDDLLFRIVDTSRLVAVAFAFERDGARVDASAVVRLTTAALPGQPFDAAYLRSGPEIDVASKTLPIRFLVQNPEGKLRAGMTAFAEIRIVKPGSSEIVSVPIAAVQRIDRDWCVFIPKGKGKFERRVVARGRDLGGEVEILSGLDANDDVVVEGAFVLRSETIRGDDEGGSHNH